MIRWIWIGAVWIAFAVSNILFLRKQKVEKIPYWFVCVFAIPIAFVQVGFFFGAWVFGSIQVARYTIALRLDVRRYEKRQEELFNSYDVVSYPTCVVCGRVFEKIVPIRSKRRPVACSVKCFDELRKNLFDEEEAIRNARKLNLPKWIKSSKEIVS